MRRFRSFAYPFVQKWVSSPKTIFAAKFGSAPDCSRANTRRCLRSFTVSFPCQLDFIRTQTQVPTPNWSRTQRPSSDSLRFGDVRVSPLTVRRTGWLELFGLPNVEQSTRRDGCGEGSYKSSRDARNVSRTEHWFWEKHLCDWMIRNESDW